MMMKLRGNITSVVAVDRQVITVITVVVERDRVNRVNTPAQIGIVAIGIEMTVDIEMMVDPMMIGIATVTDTGIIDEQFASLFLHSLLRSRLVLISSIH